MTEEKKAPTKSIEEFDEEERLARFKENQELLTTNRTLRSELVDREQRLKMMEQRLNRYEHPTVIQIERLLAKKDTLTCREIAEKLGVDLEAAEEALVAMADAGYNAHEGVLSRVGVAPKTTTEHFYGDTVRFGVISDTHIGNKHSLEEELHEAYAVFAREGIDSVYACGNLLDGEKTYRGQEYEITVMGVENVVSNIANKWPRVPGINTFHIASSSCHEGYYFKSAGILVGKQIEQVRPDMIYLGLDEADVVVHNSEARPILRLLHPGGGSSYAESYRPQKIVESYSGGEKPQILLIGHYHKAGYYDIRDVATLQAACMERQTPFMRKRSIVARLGFWIVEATFTEEGSLRRFKPEYFKYYVGREGQILRDWKV